MTFEFVCVWWRIVVTSRNWNLVGKVDFFKSIHEESFIVPCPSKEKIFHCALSHVSFLILKFWTLMKWFLSQLFHSIRKSLRRSSFDHHRWLHACRQAGRLEINWWLFYGTGIVLLLLQLRCMHVHTPLKEQVPTVPYESKMTLSNKATTLIHWRDDPLLFWLLATWGASGAAAGGINLFRYDAVGPRDFSSPNFCPLFLFPLNFSCPDLFLNTLLSIPRKIRYNWTFLINTGKMGLGWARQG